jgi:hypothetical protein
LSVAAADGLGLGHSLRLFDRRFGAVCNGPKWDERACTRARGDERLSGSLGDRHGIRKRKGSPRAKGPTRAAPRDKQDSAGDKDVPRERNVRKQRASDLGRALRSVYDDTVREPVPDDFMDLLGKLT